MKNKLLYILLLSLWIIFPSFSFASETDGVINDASKYAWGEKTGWVNFNPSNGGVHVTDEGLSGYAWSANYGWINLSPESAGVKNDGEGNLSGKVWSDKLGWMDFSGVKVDSNGNFSGTTGDENSDFGRLAFTCTDCSVATDWRPESARSDSGDNKDKNKHHSSSKENSGNNLISYTRNVGPTDVENPDGKLGDNSGQPSVQNQERNGLKIFLWIILLALIIFWIILRKKRKK